MTQTETLRNKAQERFEEYADVMSEKTFTAFHRGIQVYENYLHTLREKIAQKKGEWVGISDAEEAIDDVLSLLDTELGDSE
jgi:hypothetical protein